MARRGGECVKTADWLIFVVLIVFSLLGIFFTNTIFADTSAEYAVVTVDGKEYGRYSLNEKNGKILDVKTEFGYNKIEIKNGSVRMLDADCPDRVHVGQEAIKKPGEMFVCLPNRLVVRLEGKGGADGIAY